MKLTSKSSNKCTSQDDFMRATLEVVMPGPDRSRFTPQQVAAISHALDSLKSSAVTAFQLRYRSGLTPVQIARQHGWPESQVEEMVTSARFVYLRLLQDSGAFKKSELHGKTCRSKSRRGKQADFQTHGCPSCSAEVQGPLKAGRVFRCTGCLSALRVRDDQGAFQLEVVGYKLLNQEKMPVTLQECYRALGVQLGTPRARIKQSYLEKVKLFHPDRFLQFGVEVRRIAEHLTKILNHARDVIMAAAEPGRA